VRAQPHLTLLGGGAFGNDVEWILAAMSRALRKVADVALDVRIVSYRHRHDGVERVVQQF
jgi:hypothetical protein